MLFIIMTSLRTSIKIPDQKKSQINHFLTPFFSQVENFVGRADIILSAVTADGENLPHPVKIVNNKDPESHSRGYSYFQTKIDSTGFVDLKFGIVGVAAKDVAHWLDIRSKHHVDPFNSE